MNYDKQVDDRLRRIETKLTRLILALDLRIDDPPPPAERPADGHHNVPKADAPPTYGSAATALLKAFTRR
jgi:hypothetical protein